MIIIRTSGVSGGGGATDFTTSLVARYLFTSDASDSLGNYNTADDSRGGNLTYGSDGVRLQKSSGYSLEFESDSTAGSLSSILNDLNSNTGTISFWVKSNSNLAIGGGSDSVWIFGSYQSSSNSGAQFGFWDQNSALGGGIGGWHFFSKPDASLANYEGAVDQNDSGTDWVHIVLTVDSSTITMYKNGSSSDSYTAIAGWPRGSNEWMLNGAGVSPSTTSLMFDGWFKDLSVWSGRVLSSSEISDLYSNGHGGSY